MFCKRFPSLDNLFYNIMDVIICTFFPKQSMFMSKKSLNYYYYYLEILYIVLLVFPILTYSFPDDF